MKVFVVGGHIHYANWIKDCELVNRIDKAEIVFFTGGEDVDPSIYGCKKHERTYSNIKRDKDELEVYRQVQLHQLIVGVCRGSQLCSVLNGGLIVQDVHNHGLWGTHEITNGKEKYQITSTHHQMQYPYNLREEDYDILFWANGLSKGYYAGDGIDPEKIIERGEPEVVLYHKKNKPKCLAIQGHPEMMQYGVLHDMLNNLIEKYAPISVS